MLNEIMIRRANKVIFHTNITNKTKNFDAAASQTCTLIAELANLGYALSPELYNKFIESHPKSIETMNEILETVKELRGVRNYKPMYPNFPTQVMEASEVELYLNAITHYFSVWVADVTGEKGYIWLPKYNKLARQPMTETVKLTLLNLGTTEDIHGLFKNLLESNTSISLQDKADIVAYLHIYNLPSVKIVHKEILAFVANLLHDRNSPDLTKLFKTATDVLRFAVALSDGDVSLAENTKFRKFSRPERRMLLSLVEQDKNRRENMVKYRGPWLRLGEKLHPGDYVGTYPETYSAFEVLRNRPKEISTFNSLIESQIKNEAFIDVSSLLKTRPGVFARRLDELLRKCNTTKEATSILKDFKAVSTDIATPVLLQVMSHFKHRERLGDQRLFFPKGSIAKGIAVPNSLEPLDKSVTDKIAKICEFALINNFSTQPKLGNVYVDESLAEYLVPFSQRSASSGLKTLVRGSKIPFGTEKNTVRFFIWWKDIVGGRVDLDLSAMLYDENWNLIERIAYYNLKSDKYQCCHSGDITSAPQGACEFIDIDIPSVISYKSHKVDYRKPNEVVVSAARYVVMSVNSFTGQTFDIIPEASAGWMLREKPKSGEIFEAKTVENRINVTVKSKVCVPLIIDCLERKVIWADLAVKDNMYLPNNVDNNKVTITNLGKALSNITKPTLHELFTLHAKARGKLVKNKADADVVFSANEGTTPFDIEKIMGEYLK